MTTEIPELREQLINAARASHGGRSPLARDGRRRPAIIAVAVSLTLASGAIAATSVFPIGSKVPADEVQGPGEPKFVDGRTVVATGTSPRVGRWRMYYAETDRGVCLGVEYLDVSSGLAEGCGGDVGQFTVRKWSIPHKEVAVFGRVPAEVAAVEVDLRGGGSVHAQIHRAPPGIEGNFYFAGVPYERRPVAVRQLDADGRPLGPPGDIP